MKLRSGLELPRDQELPRYRESINNMNISKQSNVSTHFQYIVKYIMGFMGLIIPKR